MRGVTVVILTALVGYALYRYPLARWPLATALLAYAALLWRFPAAFLFILPVVLPAVDLGLWTGWMVIGESDLFVLATLSVLLLRLPPERRDLLPSGAARWVILAVVAIWIIATGTGLLSPLGAEASDNPYLRPDNALRLAKSLAEATALLPFLHHRQRTHGDAVACLGLGMAAGLGAVTLVVLAERVLFANLLDFSGAYRVAGPFSSMRVGGGHIGAYAALALPFTLCLGRLRPRWLAAGLLGIGCLAGGYTLAVTFARTAYGAGLAGMAVTGTVWLWARRRREQAVAASIMLVPVALMLAGLAMAAGWTGMRERFAETGQDYATRAGNWQAGLAVRDTSWAGTLFGLGLGTYQRAMLMRSAVNRPTDLMLRHDEGGAYVVMRVTTPFYLGQKITPPSGSLRLTLRARAEQPATLGVSVCDKVLLYADNCRGSSTLLPTPDQWQSLSVTLPAQGLGRSALLGLLHRPVELSVFGSGGWIEVRDITLVNDTGQSLLVNGDFAQGLDNWIFTDDSHVSWRMLNQYLMLFFETGVLGLVTYLALAGLAVIGALQTAGRGALEGAAVAGAVTAFLVSGLFDNVLEAPRLGTLFFLVCFCGLIQRPVVRQDARNSTGNSVTRQTGRG